MSVSTGRDGLKTLEVITAIHISHGTGTMVPLPLAGGLDHMEMYRNLPFVAVLKAEG